MHGVQPILYLFNLCLPHSSHIRAWFKNLKENVKNSVVHGGSTRYQYSDRLQNFPPFAEWLRLHVLQLCAENFPVTWNLVRLSCLPSKSVLQWKAMYVTGAHYRCLPTNCSLPNHATYDSRIMQKVNEAEGDIDVGRLQQIVMVEYGRLWPV